MLYVFINPGGFWLSTCILSLLFFFFLSLLFFFFVKNRRYRNILRLEQVLKEGIYIWYVFNLFGCGRW